MSVNKDLYLKNCEPSLQCAQFCWGNLEAAHPVLGKRSVEDVQQYRIEKGIEVEVTGGRSPPKPFQTFQETSFPDFVVELAYELFSSDAVPLPAQAQAWPCALSGMDLSVVAPTGGGKTLAYLLPALVHVMAQPELLDAEGPIALVLVPTRELAQQTLAVAARFIERTAGGPDVLRVRAVFGGVDSSIQLPSADEPDRGRWPELLVATPGRLLSLIHEGHLNLKRASYIVVDEADLLFSPGRWQGQLREVFAQCHPDRQHLLFSATWPVDADAAAIEILGDCREVAKIRVMPDVPNIPQEVLLFQGGKELPAVTARKAALAEWLRDKTVPEEAVLVLCQEPRTARELAFDWNIGVAAGGRVGLLRGDRIDAEGDQHPSRQEGSRGEYERFVSGELRVLVSTFNVGARGLDYAETTVAAANASRLSLVVLLFDFPPTIVEYIHCIGRTMRPGQKPGRAVAFLSELRYWIAGELMTLIERCGQSSPESLRTLVDRDALFLRTCQTYMQRLKHGKEPWDAAKNEIGEDTNNGEINVDGTCGMFDSEKHVWILPPCLPSYRRRLLHALADEEGLPHVSAGAPPRRCLHIARKRCNLPDRFFLEGEAVFVPGVRDTRTTKWKRVSAIVDDPRVHPQYRSIGVRFQDGARAHVCVDVVELGESGNADAA
eukprot:TRINITY_DN26519_c0_g10_i1.p1 TRINITY_DN26519_c0_g10~~TRINITY_DN26519_c0_g10_i1.p1  ORF type:complete len:663 (-),score=69.06 TRINITY_DN26519_c0_g10_i1:141-2129(-)